jgi:methylenetetrahydrofolate dehydrogenase (NADP+)/methenyltetrahydrofolate cyclohydrolase
MKPLSGILIRDQVLARLLGKKTNKTLHIIAPGNAEASRSFLREKQKTGEALGVRVTIEELQSPDEEAIIRAIQKAGADPLVGGVLVQLPFEHGMNRERILSYIPKEKDPDVLGLLRSDVASTLFPPAAGTVLEIIASTGLDLSSLAVAVIGKGFLIGDPVCRALLPRAKRVIQLGKGDDRRVLREADLVVTGTGVPGSLLPSMLKDGACVIDFGYGKDSEGKTSGDFTPSDEGTGWYTPTPGGTGPILVAKLFENFFILCL